MNKFNFKDDMFPIQFDRANKMSTEQKTGPEAILGAISTFSFPERADIAQLKVMTGTALKERGLDDGDMDALIGPSSDHGSEAVLVGRGNGPYLLGFRGAETWILLHDPDAIAEITQAQEANIAGELDIDSLADAITASLQVSSPALGDSIEVQSGMRSIFEAYTEKSEETPDIVRSANGSDVDSATWDIKASGRSPSQEWHMSLDVGKNLDISNTTRNETAHTKTILTVMPDGGVLASQQEKHTEGLSFIEKSKKLSTQSLLKMLVKLEQSTPQLLQEGVAKTTLDSLRAGINRKLSQKFVVADRS